MNCRTLYALCVGVVNIVVYASWHSAFRVHYFDTSAPK